LILAALDLAFAGVFDLVFAAEADFLAATVFLVDFAETIFLTTAVDFVEDLDFATLVGAGLRDLGVGAVFSLGRPVLPAADSLTRPLGPLGKRKIPISAPRMIA